MTPYNDVYVVFQLGQSALALASPYIRSVIEPFKVRASLSPVQCTRYSDATTRKKTVSYQARCCAVMVTRDLCELDCSVV